MGLAFDRVHTSSLKYGNQIAMTVKIESNEKLVYCPWLRFLHWDSIQEVEMNFS